MYKKAKEIFFLFEFANLFQLFLIDRKQHLQKEMVLANGLVFLPVSWDRSHSSVEKNNKQNQQKTKNQPQTYFNF